MTRRWKNVAFLAALCLATARAKAYQVLAHYDVDSLYYLSQTIVKAEVGTSQPQQTADGNCVVYEVKVLGVLKGEATVGQTYKVTGLDTYHHSPDLSNMPDAWDPMQKGDVVYLFMVPNGKTGYSMYRLVQADWTILASGARLQVGDNIYAFDQISPSIDPNAPAWLRRAPWGLDVAMTAKAFPNAPILSQKDFEARLAKAKEVNAQVEQALKAEASPAQLEALTALLRGRLEVKRAELSTHDEIGRLLAARIAEIAGDNPALLDSLRQDAARDVQFALEDALKSYHGRNYLLERVADTKEPMEKRQAWAQMLAQAGWNYSQEITSQERGEIKGVPTDFATRLARVALAQTDRALAEPLFRGLAACTGGDPADIAAAVKLLEEAFPKGTPQGRFLIADTLLQMDSRELRAFLPNVGMFLTGVEPDPDLAAGLAKNELHLTVRFRGNTMFATGAVVVLRAINGGDEYVPTPANQPNLPTNIPTFGSWRLTASLPANLPAGKYHVFMRTGGTRGRNEGIGFDMDVPAK